MRDAKEPSFPFFYFWLIQRTDVIKRVFKWIVVCIHYIPAKSTTKPHNWFCHLQDCTSTDREDRKRLELCRMEKTNIISQRPYVAELCSSLACHSFQDHIKTSPFLLATFEDLVYARSAHLLLVFSSPPFFSQWSPSHSNCFPVTIH